MNKQLELISEISKVEYEIETLQKQKKEFQKQRELVSIQSHIEQLQQMVSEDALTDRNMKLLLSNFADEIKSIYGV
jgi:SMC interacting uncharacterized protein involved in chromosome segregation